MNFFRWTQRDPKIAHLKPFVDPREPRQVAPNIEEIWRQRVAENVARRQRQKQLELSPPFRLQAN